MHLLATQDQRIITLENAFSANKTNIFSNCISCISTLTKSIQQLSMETSLLKLKVGFQFEQHEALLNFIKSNNKGTNFEDENFGREFKQYFILINFETVIQK